MNIRLLMFGLLLSTLMSGCVVHTQTIDVPLISKKNDLRVDAGISLIPGAHATISYGLTEKIAVQAFANYGADEYYVQAATGYFKNFENNRVLELYGGFGYGYGDAYKDSNPGNLNGNYQLYFGQLNYGKIANYGSKIEIGCGLKVGYLHSNLTDRNYYDALGPYKVYNDESLLFEPVGIIRLGGGKLKFSVNLGATKIFKFTNTNRDLPYGYFNLGLGLHYRL